MPLVKQKNSKMQEMWMLYAIKEHIEASFLSIRQVVDERYGKIMEKFTFEKKYQDKNYLVEEYVTKERSSKDIGKELHVSYKLIEIWLKGFDIPVKEVAF